MSLFGKRGEELDQIKDRVEELISRMESLEQSIKSSIDSGMEKIRESLDSVKGLYPDVLLEEFRSAINMLKAALHVAEYLKDYGIQLKDILELQNSQVGRLEELRSRMAEEYDRIRAERDRLEGMRRQMEEWRRELESKEANLSSYEQDIAKLEERKQVLEQTIKELSERYFNLLDITNKKIEETITGIDRRFRVREIRLERLVRLEERKREELSKLQADKLMLEEMQRRASSLVDDIQRLERRKAMLINEIKKLEEDRRELERLKQDLRSEVLK